MSNNNESQRIDRKIRVQMFRGVVRWRTRGKEREGERGRKKNEQIYAGLVSMEKGKYGSLGDPRRIYFTSTAARPCVFIVKFSYNGDQTRTRTHRPDSI